MGIIEKLKALKAAIYIRVSTQWQVDKDSLQVQRRELIAYCEMVLGIKDYVIFEDPGYSAKNTDRPDYQRMIDRLRTGEFSHVVVWKIDRISRNLLDFATMYAELKELGITFVSKNEQFDTSNAIGEAMLKIILVFAELERQMTAERVTAVMLSRANVGDWNGGRVPYAYSYDKSTKEFSLDPQEYKVYNTIVSLYEEHLSVLYVTRWLNDAGLTTRSGKPWTTTAVYKILTNPWYMGSYRYNVHKEGSGYKMRSEDEWITVENHHVPAIDDVRFDRIQFLLKRNRRGGVAEGQSYVKKNIHLFAGMIRCGLCGANMSATLDRRRADGWRPSIYGCSTRRHNSKKCGNKYISDAALGPFIFNFIANIIRASRSINGRTTADALEKKLLRGSAFSGARIRPDSLQALQELLLSGSNGMEYKPATVFDEKSTVISEREILEDRRRRDENALNRLKSLYLYGDDAMAEKDFIIERQKILDDLEATNAKLAELKKAQATDIIPDDDFMQKASYFIMVEKLLDDRFIDYEKYIRSIDPGIPRSFLRMVLKKAEATDGKVTALEFSNNLRVDFLYE